MSKIEAVKLSDVLNHVKKPKYVLATTYTLSLAFFESMVFPCFSREELQACLILCDIMGYRNALTEAPALQGAAQDYMVVPAPINGSFHPKVWLIMSDEEVCLLTGSGNLTQAGFMANAEYFDVAYFSRQQPPDDDLLKSISSFIKGLMNMWPPSEAKQHLCVSTLYSMQTLLNSFPIAANTSQERNRFIHSFQGDLIAQLPAAESTKALYLAAPFFGNSTSGLKLLTKRYPPSNLHIFPAVHEGKETDMPLQQVAKEYPKAKVSRLSTGKAKSKLAHLKLYGHTDNAKQSWIFCTSANCTKAAWTGPNVEAGFLRYLPATNMTKFFCSENGALPIAPLKRTLTSSPTDGTLYFSATYSGDTLNISLAESAKKFTPLRDVTLTIRSGSDFSMLKAPALFEASCKHQLNLKTFNDWVCPQKKTILLQCEASSSSGEKVKGACLIENMPYLTAGPAQRNAMRAISALFDLEGFPELADIAALYKISSDLLDGHVPLGESGNNHSGTGLEGTTRNVETESSAVAVWPPEPNINELRHLANHGNLGSLHWLDHIFNLYLRNDPAVTQSTVHGHANFSSEENDEEALATTLQYKQEDVNCAHSKALLEQATKNFERCYNRLKELTPTQAKAKGVWIASVLCVISTLSIIRLVKRRNLALVESINTNSLCERFLNVLLKERRQQANYSVLKTDRYRTNVFPALAKDLQTVFGETLPRRLLPFMLALVTNLKLIRTDAEYPEMWRSYLKYLLGSDYEAGLASYRESLQIWRKCVGDEKHSDSEFEAAFKALFCYR